MEGWGGTVFINLRFDVTHVNFAALTELYRYGTVVRKKVNSARTVNSFKDE